MFNSFFILDRLTLFQRIGHYFSLVRFSHTLFALPFAALSAAMALNRNLSQTPPVPLRWVEPIGLLLCMVFARSAAMGFNRWADRGIDADNPRTASRHLPGGILGASEVLIFVAVCSVGFILSTLLFLPNRIPIAASVPVLLFLFGYSYAKRWTVTAHFWLGTALMLAPVAAWVAVRPDLDPFPWPPVLLGLAVLFWSAGFDLIYACQDAEIDARAHLYSIPGRYGVRTAFTISALCHAAAVILFASVPLVFPPFGMVYGLGVALVALLLLAEHGIAAPGRAKPIDLVRINIAFFQMNVLVSLGLLLVGLIDLIRI